MRALRKRSSEPGDVGLEEVPPPVAACGQALIEVWATGICGTDLHISEGSFTSYPPVTMGHEVTGVVSAVGEGVPSGWIGRHVVSETFFSTDGECPWCRDGRPNLCPERRSIGSGADGGFAPWMVVPAHNLHAVPEGIDPCAAALSEPLACVCQSLLDPAPVEPGDDVLITGPGTMGLLSAQVARACGGSVLMVGTDHDQVRLAAAEELGFRTALAGDDAVAAALGGGYGPHVVIECSGSAQAMAAGLEVVRRGGRYVQIGQTDRAVPVRLAQVSFHELTITGGFASTPHSWRRAMDLLSLGMVRLEPLVTEVAPLADWQRVFADTAAARGIKYLLDPRAGR
jgi:L-iditol 2-dehydrogenase